MARILISMPDKFLESIDKLADTEQRTRSELVREALRNYIKKAIKTAPKQAKFKCKTFRRPVRLVLKLYFFNFIHYFFNF